MVTTPAVSLDGYSLRPCDPKIPLYRVVVLDDDSGRLDLPIQRAEDLLNIEIEVIEHFYQLEELIRKLPRLPRVDLFILDLGGVCRQITSDDHEPLAGFVAASTLELLRPGSNWAILSRLYEPDIVGLAVRLGALAYWPIDDVHSHDYAESFGKQLVEAANGGLFLGGRAKASYDRWNSEHPPVSDLLVPLRSGVELLLSEAQRLERALAEQMPFALRTVFEDCLQRCDDLWARRLMPDGNLQAFNVEAIDSRIAVSVAQASLRAQAVTPRQTGVLMLLSEGLTQAQVGQRLHISRKTVERHVRNARDRLRDEFGLDLRGVNAAVIAELVVGSRSLDVEIPDVTWLPGRPFNLLQDISPVA